MNRVIWIDQICINQSDVEEKSHQVALMSHIYKYCKEVFLWLGEDGSLFGKTIEDPDELERSGSFMIWRQY